MRALITTACWGKDYIDYLARFSAASLLSPENIPKTSTKHDVTWQLISPRRDLDAFAQTESFARIEKYCHLDIVAFEDHDLDPNTVPVGFDNEKYTFLSELQNLAMKRAIDHDVILFNYADCLWQDGSLAYVVDRIGEGQIDAVLTLGMPVDETRGKLALEAFRETEDADSPLILPPRQTSRLILDNMHREARLRYWEKPPFTVVPSYMVWDVEDEGAVVRCCHQTLAAMRVKPDDPIYAAGITHGSLDGEFSGDVVANWPFEIASDADKLALFSLYEANFDSSLPSGVSREVAFKRFLLAVALPQRELLLTPILLKYRYDQVQLWDDRIEQSEIALRAAADGSRGVLSFPLTVLIRFLMQARSFLAKLVLSSRRAGRGMLGNFVARLRGLARRLLNSVLATQSNVNGVAGAVPTRRFRRLKVFLGPVWRLLPPPLASELRTLAHAVFAVLRSLVRTIVLSLVVAVVAVVRVVRSAVAGSLRWTKSFLLRMEVELASSLLRHTRVPLTREEEPVHRHLFTRARHWLERTFSSGSASRQL